MNRWKSPEDFEREWDAHVAEAMRAAAEEARRADPAVYVARLAQRLADTEERGESTAVAGIRRRKSRSHDVTATAAP